MRPWQAGDTGSWGEAIRLRGMLSAWPTVLRQRHMETVSQALRTRGVVHGGVVLTGGAGVGKTTLARRAMNGTAATTRWLAGTETARGIPLGAFAHLVDIADPHEPHSILRAAREHLLAGSPDVLIGVDGAHMLDQLSATVVHQLAIEHAAKFVVTVRTGQDVPDAITALWKDGLLTRVDLAAFDRQELVELVETVLDGSLESVSADRLYEISQGNPPSKPTNALRWPPSHSDGNRRGSCSLRRTLPRTRRHMPGPVIGAANSRRRLMRFGWRRSATAPKLLPWLHSPIRCR